MNTVTLRRVSKQGARKYNFDNMEVNIPHAFGFKSTSNANTCFKQFIKTRKLKWEYLCYKDKETKLIYIVRTK